MTVRGDGSRRAPTGKADSDHVRRQNRSLVLSALRRREPIARVDLGAEAMHTMAPRAVALIDELCLRHSMLTARTGESYLWTPRGRRRRSRAVA